MLEQEPVLRGIEAVARQVFASEAIALQVDTTAEEVPGWDSLTHVLFMLELERAFSVRIPQDLVLEFRTVGELAAWLQANASPATA